jgi:uncharacterized membrane protein
MHAMAIPLPTFSPDHLHPILVNFTAALVPASVGSDLLGRGLRKPSMHTAAWWMIVYAAAITPLTAISGLWWKSREAGMLPARTVAQHQWLGVALVVCFVLMAMWRYRIYRRNVPPSVVYLIVGIVLVAALVVQGALGGEMLLGG